MKNTKLNYLYRDGSNYKAHNAVVFQGVSNAAGKILEVEYFVPSAVGLEDLQDRMIGGYGEEDHPYHEIENIEITDEDPTETVSIQDFEKKFSETDWEPHALMIIARHLPECST